MDGRLRRLLSPPVFEDEDRTRLARLLHVILTMCLLASLGVTAVVLGSGQMRFGWALVGIDAVTLVAFWQARRGLQRAASLLFLVGLLAFLTHILAMGQGIHDVAMMVYPILIILASLLLEGPWYPAYAVLAVASVIGVAVAELTGSLQTPYAAATSLADVAVVAILLGVTAFSLRAISRHLMRSLARARRHREALLTANHDLTRHAEQLRDSEARWRSLVENAPDLILHLDPDGTVVFVNTQHHPVLRPGAPVFDFLEPKERDRFRAVLQEACETGEAVSCEVCGRHQDGTLAWFEARLSPIRHEGRVYRLTVIATDISDRKRVEAERERLIAELEAKNAELERFTYTVSHDLKSPLISIKGFLGYLTQDVEAGDREQAAQDVARIAAAADRMGQLLDDLLALSRIGRVVHPAERVPFETLVHEALERVEGRFRERGVAVSVAPGLPVVSVDRPRLVAVLQNLLDNAAKFMGDQAAPRVEVGFRQDDERPAFYVRDNGAGIAPRFREQVFGLFERLDPSVEGTGIGLALVRRTIEVHGGTVWIEPTDGGGTTVAFTLPHALAPVPEAAPETAPPP